MHAMTFTTSKTGAACVSLRSVEDSGDSSFTIICETSPGGLIAFYELADADLLGRSIRDSYRIAECLIALSLHESRNWRTSFHIHRGERNHLSYDFILKSRATPSEPGD